jgi:fibronectin-binding autotransporter adhesin
MCFRPGSRLLEVEMKSLLRNFAVVAIVLAAHGTAHAQTLWNVASGNWSTDSNWNPATVPVSGDVSISNSGTATLNTNSTLLASLTIGSGSVLEKDNTGTNRSITMSTAPSSGLITNSGTIRYGQATTGTFTITSGLAGWNNNSGGLITTSAAGQTLALVAGGNITVTNSGTVRADGGILNLLRSSTDQSFNITNTGGLLRATNGGTLSMNSGVVITGGSLQVDAGSFFRANRQNTTTTLTNVTVTNAGSMLSQSTATRYTIEFLGTTALTNSGTLEYLTSGSGTQANGSAASTATITNQATGIIRVFNNRTSGTANAFFTNSTSSFTNLGSIEIKSNAALAAGSSQFRSTAVDFTNAGSFLVDGPVSSIAMTGRTFTQSGGSLSLIGGGSMVATSVLINGGTLLGTGTINAPVTVGGSVAPGNAGIGTLSVTNGVTWNAGNAWLFELGASGVDMDNPGTSDLLSLTGTFTKGTGSTFTFDFANSGSDGWYKLVDYTSTNFTPGTNTSFAATNVPAGKSANFVVDAGSTALYVQIVPEPSTLALAGLGIGLAGLIASRRRRRG